ncbi:gliding motility-associated C-terminal domain-containing protein [Runella sp.]|uniref:T9SS type B sorting domain-containing protein n=1 Tax=Runella sp. TaxID=1960881 RepID=UPI003D0B57BB
MAKLYLVFGLWLLTLQVQAQRIYGGHFDRRNPVGAFSGQPYAYRFACTFYADAQGANALPDRLTFRIIQKSTNTVVKEYTARKDQDTQSSAVLNDCGSAGGTSGINYLFVRYNYDTIVNPIQFNDSQGYYVVNAPVGARNPSANVASSPIVLYHWFSPQYLFEQLNDPNDGKAASGWIPESYKYICKGQSNRINIGVGIFPAQTTFNPQTFNLVLRNAVPVTSGSLPFKEVDWKSGFSASSQGMGNSVVPSGNAVFTNNSSTSSFIVTLTPPQTGVFSVAFLTEQSRNGVLLCINYREMQFEVNDCSQTNSKPLISVSKVGKPALPALTAVCEDSIVQLNLKSYAKGSAFQWKLNNTDIPNATDTVLVIRNNQTGVYTCTVKNELLCPKTITSDPVTISLVPKPTVSVTAGNPSGTPCVDGTIKLTVTASGAGALTYQWYRENKKIDGATSTSYEAIETGVYAIRVTDSNGCATTSGNSPVIPSTPPKADIRALKNGYCKGNNLTLYSTSGRTNIYQWMRDGQPIGGIKDSVIISQAGVYTVKVTAPNSCSTTSLPLTIIQYPEPVVTVDSQGNQLCQGTSLSLTAKGVDLKKFEWRRNGQAISGASKDLFTVNQEGNYAVSVTDTNGCKAVSKEIEIKKVDKITVQIDSIPDFCGISASPIALKGIPAGGNFSGPGIANATFDPKMAGIGRHVITYTVKGNLDCLNGEAQKTVTVSSPPALNLGEDRIIFKGASVTLNADMGVGYTYHWTPESGVDNPALAKTTFTPEHTTTYHITAKGPMECLAEDSITIRVFSGIYVPEVFTPNGDGQNDTWELKGLEAYPAAEVTIVNRWGQVIFFEKGNTQKNFDGTVQGDSLPIGEYAFIIRTEPNGHVLRGKFLLLR